MNTIAVIRNPIDALTAQKKVQEYREEEIKKAISGIVDFIQVTPWEKIREYAANGRTGYTFTIGTRYREGKPYDTFHTNWYGMNWLAKKGNEIIKNLFESLGYRVIQTMDKYEVYTSFIIDWAE